MHVEDVAHTRNHPHIGHIGRTDLLTPWSRVLLEKLTVYQLVTSTPRILRNLEDSLPRLQVPTTCPYSKADQSSPCPPIQLPEDPSKCYPLIYA